MTKSHKSGEEFELQVAHLYRDMGYVVRTGAEVCGQEVDILAERPLPGSAKIVVMVECKFKGGRTRAGNEDIQSIAAAFQIARAKGLVHSCIVVTTNGFSRAAQAAAEASGVQTVTFSDLVRSLLDLTPYTRRLLADHAARFGEAEESWYVPLRARVDKAPATPLDDIVDDWLTHPGARPLAILGGYGVGKSSFCLHYATRLIAREGGPLPIIIRLRDFNRAARLESLVRDLLDEELEAPAPRFGLFRRMFEAGHLVVFLDGFDEMATRVDATTLEINVTEIGRLARSGRVILTCRPEFFVTHEEQDLTLRATHGLAERRTAFDLVELEMWRDEDVEIYVRKRVAASPTDKSADYYVDSIRTLPGLGELSTRPVHLELIVRLLPDLVARGAELDRVSLFETYIQHELRRERVTNRRLLAISDDERVDLIKEMAARQVGTGRMSLDFEQAARLVRERLTVPAPEVEAVTRDFLNRSFLERSGREYRFAHKAIGEYLLALDLHRRLRAGDLSWVKDAAITAAIAGLVLDVMGGPKSYLELLDILGVNLSHPTNVPSQLHELRVATYAIIDHIKQIVYLSRKLALDGQKPAGTILYPIGLAHDLNNSATHILGNIELALTDDQIASECCKDVVAAWPRFRERAIIVARTSFDARTPADLFQLKMVEFDIASLAMEAGRIYGLGTRMAVSGAVSLYRGDRDFLLSVFENLAANAARYMSQNDRLAVRIERVGAGIRLEWENTGSTIDSKLAQDIFEFGFTSRSDGFGVGLAVARLFIEMHGGRISIVPMESGACFRVDLPAPGDVPDRI